MERLERYTPKNSRDDTVRVLKAFFDFLPPDGKANLVTDLRSFETDEQVRIHADSLVQSLLIPMKACRATLSVETSPRMGIEDSIENISAEMTESARRQARLKHECLRRDGRRCTITGHLERSFRDHSDFTTRTVNTACAHIIPFSLGSWQNDREAQTKAIIWVTLNRCFPSLRRRINFNHESINDHRNLITMYRDLYHYFGDFLFALEETNTIHRYRIKCYEPSSLWYLPSTISFHQHDYRYDLPDPELLKIHAIIARILHASGKAEEIEKLVRDRDEISVLAKDGSTNVGSLLATTSLGALQLLGPQNVLPGSNSGWQSDSPHIKRSISCENEGKSRV